MKNKIIGGVVGPYGVHTAEEPKRPIRVHYEDLVKLVKDSGHCPSIINLKDNEFDVILQPVQDTGMVANSIDKFVLGDTKAKYHVSDVELKKTDYESEEDRKNVMGRAILVTDVGHTDGLQEVRDERDAELILADGTLLGKKEDFELEDFFPRVFSGQVNKKKG